MRIVSQDGQMNLSLDIIHLSTGKAMDDFTINARDSFWDRPVTLAKYSTMEKCQEVFNMIIESCSKGFSVVILPEDKDVGV